MDDAAGMMVVMDELRPLNSATLQYNKFVEVWRRIARVPPWHRHLLLEEIEPGACRSVWKASLGRYVLRDKEAAAVLRSHSVWRDLPEKRGELGACLWCLAVVAGCVLFPLC